jgi:hypothetical protein
MRSERMRYGRGTPRKDTRRERARAHPGALRAVKRRTVWAIGWIPMLLLLGVLGLTAGCCTTATLPRVNLKEPGWTVHRGQAIWRRQRGGEGVAGEILVATRADGRAFVQFSKGPFPIVVAQSTPSIWSAEFPPQNAHHSGCGRPPKRIIFLYLPRVLLGLAPPRHWSWQELSQGGWRLENESSGESLEVHFSS